MRITSARQKACYHGLLIQVESRLDQLALVKFRERQLIVPAEDLKEAGPQFAVAAYAAGPIAKIQNGHTHFSTSFR